MLTLCVRYLVDLRFYSLIPGAVQLRKKYDVDNPKPFGTDQNTSQQNLFPKETNDNQMTSFRTLLSSFAVSTTAHGFERIATASSLPRCVLWCVISVGFYVILSWMCAVLVLRYSNKPVVSRMEMSFEEVTKPGRGLGREKRREATVVVQLGLWVIQQPYEL